MIETGAGNNSETIMITEIGKTWLCDQTKYHRIHIEQSRMLIDIVFGRGNTQRGSCVFFKGWIEERTISFPHNNGTFTSTLNRGCAVDGDII
ncbi:hypothetical protein F2Q69_00046625 [Brassica cretica]|uniref:Uncharacterized protein n=1 Tax=Brassica cretica TaxID=69181 RepID=A0A8S9PR90_BRACR|nr:hypothetical protein F2Q69_00046625 [Brassica cretica]